MNIERLLAAFSKIGDDPNRIQQMRKIAVALAISGKLTTEAARLSPSQMIDALNRLKTELTNRGAISKTKKHGAIKGEQLPEGFSDASQFAPLGDIARIDRGRTAIRQARPGPFPLVVTAAERASCDHFDFDGAAAIVPLISSTGHGNASLNRLHYQEGQFALGTILAAVFPHDPDLISARFLFEYLAAFKEELLVSRMTGTANVTLTVGRIAEVPVPLICPDVQRTVDQLMRLCDRLVTARETCEATRDRLTATSFARLTGPGTDVDTLRAHSRFVLDSFPALTIRPDQIKTVRQTILNLAVRGKLAEQNAADKPVEQALRGIRAEREELVRAKFLRCEKALVPIVDVERPFDIPASWKWTRIGEVALFTQYGTSAKAKPLEDGVPVLAMGNIQDGLVICGNEKKLPRYSNELPNLLLKKFDLLYNRTNSAELVGKTGIYLGEDDCRTFASYLIRLRFSLDHSSPRYVNLAMNAPSFRQTQIVPLIKKQTGQANVNGTALKNMLVPLPPVPEQHRIVAKVDLLMALCDRLEASQREAETARRRLLDALLHEALHQDTRAPAAEALEAAG